MTNTTTKKVSTTTKKDNDQYTKQVCTKCSQVVFTIPSRFDAAAGDFVCIACKKQGKGL